MQFLSDFLLFYLNYEECKDQSNRAKCFKLHGFILTMRNVKVVVILTPQSVTKFYLNYEECKAVNSVVSFEISCVLS